MRAHEFINEKVSADFFNRPEDEPYMPPTQNVRIGDFEFNARTFTGGLGSPDAQGLQIRAYDPKKPKGSASIGSADFIMKTDKKGRAWLEADDTEVDDEYRGRGIATMMYAFAKSLGNDIRRSPYQSAAGSAMWNKWGQDAQHLVGESRDQGAAGIILYAQDTGRYGLQQRADTIDNGGLWAAWGGGREPGETLEQCALRELAEESGYTGPVKLKKLAENPQYATFIGVVPHEFEPRPDPEWKDFCWVAAGDWPSPMHPGVAAALRNIPVNEDRQSSDSRIEQAALDFYQTQVGDVDAGPVDDFRQQAQELLRQSAPGIKDKVLAALKKANANPYIQGGVITTVGAVLAGGVLASAQRMGLNSTQTNILLQAILNTVIPTMVSRVNGKSWRDTMKYTLASAGIGTAIASVTENFADKKVKGRSRPGRVKRAGASCAGSVTDLRARAKKYGGERGRMYHWCANMKGGKKK